MVLQWLLPLQASLPCPRRKEEGTTGKGLSLQEALAFYSESDTLGAPPRASACVTFISSVSFGPLNVTEARKPNVQLLQALLLRQVREKELDVDFRSASLQYLPLSLFRGILPSISLSCLYNSHNITYFSAQIKHLHSLSSETT